MTGAQLARELASLADIPDYQAGNLVRNLVRIVRSVVENGGQVTISGLGTLRVKRCGSRVIEDFRGRVHTTRGRKISFRPSKSLRALLS